MNKSSKVTELPYQICNRCVMDTSDPFIHFDESGNCNHCNDFLKTRIKVTAHNSLQENNLESFFEKIKMSRSKGTEYDLFLHNINYVPTGVRVEHFRAEYKRTGP